MTATNKSPESASLSATERSEDGDGKPIAQNALKVPSLAELDSAGQTPNVATVQHNVGVDFAKDTHANIQDLVKVADAKATSLIAFQGLVLAIFGSSLVSDIALILRAGGSGSEKLLVVCLATLLLTLGSIISGVAVLVPREPLMLISRPPGARGLLWLKDLERYERNAQGYISALRQTTTEDSLADFAYENLKVAWILRKKFRFLNLAIWMLLFALIAWTATIVTVVGTSLPASQ